MPTFIAVFRRFSRPVLLVLSAVLVLFVGALNYAAGERMSFSLFYLVPISFATWLVSRWAGIIFSILSAAVIIIVRLVLHRFEYPAILYLNVNVELGFFLVFTFMLDAFKRELARERKLARMDPLTGVANVRSFYASAAVEMERSRRYKHQFTVAYMDVDNFKKVNDELGHNEGDRLLATAADIIRSNLRSFDVLARLGGDEFIILLPETGQKPADLVLSRVLRVLDDSMYNHEWPVTFSIGAVTFLQAPASVADMIRQADTLMYEAKRAGKNRIRHEVHQPD